MEKKEVMERLDELMKDENNNEAIITAIHDSNALGYFEAYDDIGKHMIVVGSLMLFGTWVGRKFL